MDFFFFGTFPSFALFLFYITNTDHKPSLSIPRLPAVISLLLLYDASMIPSSVRRTFVSIYGAIAFFSAIHIYIVQRTGYPLLLLNPLSLFHLRLCCRPYCSPDSLRILRKSTLGARLPSAPEPAGGQPADPDRQRQLIFSAFFSAATWLFRLLPLPSCTTIRLTRLDYFRTQLEDLLSIYGSTRHEF